MSPSSGPCQRPDVDVSSTGVIGRVHRLNRLLEQELRAFFAEHDLGDYEFDILATLRRSGAPYEMTAGAFLRASLVSSGSVTHRIDRMERKGLVERVRPPDDRRVVRTRLTTAGLTTVDDLIAKHMTNQGRMLAALNPEQRDALADSLRSLLVSLGNSKPE